VKSKNPGLARAVRSGWCVEFPDTNRTGDVQCTGAPPERELAQTYFFDVSALVWFDTLNFIRVPDSSRRLPRRAPSMDVVSLV